MHQNPYIVLAIASFSALAARGQAQDPQAIAASSLIPIHTAADDVAGGAYGIWAGGADFKVSFHDGMAFYPHVGDRQAVSLRWTTKSVRRGENQLVDGRTPTGSHTDLRYEYDHGSFVEAYDIRVDGIEQTFVLERRPAGHGDLVIRGAMQSQLRANDRGASHDGIEFRDHSGEVGIDYGAATAVDARGRRLPMTSSHVDGEIALTVPGAWLDSASYPLVVDPVIGGFVRSQTEQITRLDVFRDSREAALNVWVVETRLASSGDSDLLVRRYNDDFSGGTIVYSDLATQWSTEHGAICGVGGTQKTVTAFERVFGGGSDIGVRWHTHDKDDATLNTVVRSVSTSSTEYAWRPDVGGTRALSIGGEVLLVFQRDQGVTFSNTSSSETMAGLIDTATDNFSVVPYVLSNNPNRDQELPSVNQIAENGNAFSWVIAWQIYDNSRPAPNTWDIIAKTVDNNGVRSTGTLTLSADGHTVHDVSPMVAGSDGRYLVASAQIDLTTLPFKTGGLRGERIHAQRFDWTHGRATGSRRHNSQEIYSDVAIRAQMLGCAFDSTTDSHWVTAVGNSATGQLTIQRLGFRGAPVETSFPFASPGASLAAAASFDESNRNTIVWASHSSSTQVRQLGYRMEHPNPAPVSIYGTGCSNASVLWRGTRLVGSEFESYEVTTGAASRPGFLLVGTSRAAFPLDQFGLFEQGCFWNVASTMTFPVSTDSTGRVNLPLKLTENTPAAKLNLQYFYQPVVGFLVGTRALEVDIAR